MEAGSPFGRVVIFHSFTNLKSGRFAFDDLKGFSAATAKMASEFLDAIWPVRGERGHARHLRVQGSATG